MVTFELKTQPGPKADLGPVEYVRIDDGAQVVNRKATEEDKRLYFNEYRLFKSGKQQEAAVVSEPPVVFAPRQLGQKGEVEFVKIQSGKDVVHRPATDYDREVHARWRQDVAPVAEATTKVDVIVPPEAFPDDEVTPVDTPKKKSLFGKKK